MATALRPTSCVVRPRARIFGGLNFGPRFTENCISVNRDNCSEKFSLYYRIYNPTAIRSMESPPLVVVHGGPSLPSDYLFPLVQNLPTSRSIIFYDQLGCGRSSRPEDEEMYSVENAADDLDALITSLKLDNFHLLGHSYGGIVCFEFLKKSSKDGNENLPRLPKCLSVVLANTPCNMETSLKECARLKEEMREELSVESHGSNDVSLDKDVEDRLRKRNECRTDAIPVSLANAIENRGTVFCGPEAVSDYVASHSEHDFPPVLLIRGEHDFITEECIKGWRKIFESKDKKGTSYREEVMKDCSHYCHLENGRGFGDLVKNHCFINDY